MEKQLYRPTREELEAMRGAATKNGAISEERWVQENIAATASLLKRDPRRYRAYGPYWWILKKTMIAHGVTDFGEHVDAHWAELCDYGSDFYNLLAAWLYQDTALDNGLIYSNAHTVAYMPQTEGMEHDVDEYVLADDEMELLGFEQRT